jgi:hypothetical protein
MVNSGQMLLVLGALLLFSLIMPALNGTMLYNDRSMTVSKVQVNAMAIAQKFLSEAATKEFDQNAFQGGHIWYTSFTPPGSLGAETGEVYPNYNDVDDYNSLSLIDSTSMPSVRFTITGNVTYVDANNPGQPYAIQQTYVKRVRITVSSTFLVNPVNQQPQPIYYERLYTYF